MVEKIDWNYLVICSILIEYTAVNKLIAIHHNQNMVLIEKERESNGEWEHPKKKSKIKIIMTHFMPISSSEIHC